LPDLIEIVVTKLDAKELLGCMVVAEVVALTPDNNTL
jgi:hypothetical protein